MRDGFRFRVGISLLTAVGIAAGALVGMGGAALAADYANGLTINLVNVTPLVFPDKGSVTVTVTNDPDTGGAAQNFTVFVSGNGFPASEVRGPVADGATSTEVTFSGALGSWRICAEGDTLVERDTEDPSTSNYFTPNGCMDVTMTDGTAQAYTGSVEYAHRCDGLRYTVTNSSARKADYFVTTSAEHVRASLETWTLAPGATRTGSFSRAWGGHVDVEVAPPNSGPVAELPSATWRTPDSCPMLGGTSLVRWSDRLGGHPAAIVRTKAFCPRVGYQVKGSRKIHWAGWFDGEKVIPEGGDDCPVPGRHRVRMMGHYLRPGQAITLRLWVKYDDEFYQSRGRTRFTGWHRFRR